MNDLVLTSPEPRAITPQEMIQTAFQKAIEQGAAMDVVQAIIAQQWPADPNDPAYAWIDQVGNLTP